MLIGLWFRPGLDLSWCTGWWSTGRRILPDSTHDTDSIVYSFIVKNLSFCIKILNSFLQMMISFMLVPQTAKRKPWRSFMNAPTWLNRYVLLNGVLTSRSEASPDAIQNLIEAAEHSLAALGLPMIEEIAGCRLAPAAGLGFSSKIEMLQLRVTDKAVIFRRADITEFELRAAAEPQRIHAWKVSLL